MKKSSRILAFVLTLLMVVSLMPVSALADELAPASAAESLLLPGMVDIPAIEETEEPVATETPAPTEAPAETEQPEATEAPVLPELDVVLPEVGSAADAVIGEAAETEEEAPVEDVEEAAEDGATTLVAEAVFASDVHASTSAVSGVFSAIESDYGANIISGAGFAGDTAGDGANGGGDSSYTDPADITSAVKTALDDQTVTCVYSYGSHDKGYVTDMTGELYENANYYVYAISQSAMSSSSSAKTATESFTSWVATTDAAKPIFILSHQPLHERRNDNGGAANWYTAIEAAAGTRDITFFWAHNHTGETSVDTNAYYVAKDGSETFTVEGGSTVTPGFTYMNAGYIGKSGVGRGGVASLVSIYSDSMVFQDYNSSGTYSGSYAHNVTVAREFASSGSTTPTLSSISVVRNKLMYSLGEDLDITVYAIYEGQAEPVEVTDYTTDFDPYTAGVQKVTVSYGGKSTTMEDVIVAAAIVHSDVSIDEYEETASLSALQDGTAEICREWTCYLSNTQTLSLDWEITDNGDGTYTVTCIGPFSEMASEVTYEVNDDTLVLTSVDNTYADEGYNTATKTYTINSDGTLEENTSGTNNTVTGFIYGEEVDGVQNSLGSIQATATGLTGITAEVNAAAAIDTALSEVYFDYDYVYFDVSLAGHTDGNEVFYSVAVMDGVDTTNLEVYYVNEDNTLVQIPCTVVTDEQGNKYVEFTTTYVGTFAYGAAAVPDGYALDKIEISNVVTTRYFVNDNLDLYNPILTATYTMDGAEDFVRLVNIAYEDVTIAYDMTVVGKQTVTFDFQGKTDSFDIEVFNKEFTDEGVKVVVTVPSATELTVAPSENANVAEAIRYVIEDGTYVAYDIELAGYNDGETVTVTLPLPEGLTNPVVYYVSDDGKTVTNMNATKGEGVVTFTTDHFSTYVLGDGTTIDLESGNAIVEGSSTTTTEEKTVYVKVDAPVDGEEYLIVSTGTAGTAGYILGGSSVTPVSGTLTVDGTDGTYTYIETTGTLWTASGSDSSWSFANGSNYLGYTQNSSGSFLNGYTYSYDVNTGASSTTWTLNNSQLYIYLSASSAGIFGGSNSSENYYLTGGSSWSMDTTAANIYFYKEVTATITTTTGTVGGYYSTVGADITDAVAVNGQKVTLSSVLYWTPEDTKEAEVTNSGITPTYEVVTTKGNPNVIAKDENGDYLISDNTATLSGTAGTAVVKVTYTSGDLVAWDEFIVTAVAPTYAVAITDPEASQLKIGAAQTLVATATMNDAAIEGATITWSTSDDSIATVDENGIVTGVAAGSVTITAVYTDPNGTDHTDEIELEVVDAVYALDLCKPVVTYTKATAYTEGETYYTETDGVYTEATGVTADNFADKTYYTATTTHESITQTIIIKDVMEGMQTYLWAVITADGEDIGALNEEQLKKLTFVSSNETIAIVDKTTGVVTFKGGEGTVTITAIYEYADGKSVTDTVVYSVSADHYYVPEDGTDDFPDYPNEGAVRHDKTATAVGNFSETGVAKVELSMTGVPYTTGSEIDVVVMLDMTGSMSDNGMIAAEEATVAFVEKIVKNEDGTYNNNRVAVYAFNSGSSSPYELVALDTISSDAELTTANTAIRTASTKQAQGGTPFDKATKQCYDVLQAAKTTNLPEGVDSAADYDRQQFCVFMSDGGPTTYYGSDEKTYYGGNNNSGDVQLTSCMTGYSSSDSSKWSFTLPTEYYTDALKADGVTVYTVGLLLQTAPSNPAPYSSMTDSTYDSTTDSLTAIGSHYYFTSSILKQMASDSTKYIDIFNVDNADKATAAFTSIAKDILSAATDVTVGDKIGSNYTMVFDAPNAVVDAADGGQEYYIEVTDYTLEPVYADDGVTITDYVRGTGTSLLKLYFGYDSTTGYYAATDANGTKAATPTFDTVTLGDKGTKYYWTTDSDKGDSDVSVVGADGTTYYFVSTGDGTHNMTAGAYASGTNTTVALMYDDGTTGTSSTCQDMIIATPYFVYNAATKMLIWTLEEIADNEITLTYFLYLNNSGGFSGTKDEIEPKTYETNQFAYVNYTNFQKKECELTFPVPQMTWNGAQVSYTFYLVNDAGQPVNRAGRVVPFSEAIYVTDVFTHSIVWNDLEQAAGLEAERLAEDLVPDVYALYDAGAAYNIHVYEDFNKVNLNNHFVISSSVDTDNSTANNGVYTTYVFNTKADTTKYTEPGVYVADNGNNTAYESGQAYWCKSYDVTGTFEKTEHTDEVYGTYYVYTVTSASYSGSQTQVLANSMTSTAGGTIIDGYVYYVDENEQIYTIVTKNDGNEVHNGFDFSNTTVAFAVVWKPELKEDVVVIDYGLDVVVDVIATDSLAAGVVGVRTDAPSGITINSGTYEAAEVKSVDVSLDSKKIGTAIVESQDAVRFSLDEDNGMQMSAPVKFYYEADVNYYKDGELQTTSMYSSVTVIPATTIYYEDSFVSFTDGSGGSTGTWSAETTQSETQDMDRPGPDKIGTVKGTRQDADNVYGYDSAYDNMATYSMGSARYVTVSAANNPSKGGTWPTAEFTFTGTGFDIISMTDNTTGTIFVKVYKVTDGVAETEATRSWVVDTFYGYTRTLNGEYPAIKYTWLYNSNGEWRVVEEELVQTKGEDENKPSNPVAGETTFVTYEDNYDWTITTGENSLYQIPVIKHSGLDYGTYKVVIQPTFSTAFDNAGTGSYDFYLDAIRIYDPAGVVSGDNPMISEEDSVSGVYKEDSEGWPEYVELRDQILAQGAFDTTEDNITGAVFIDGDGTSGTFSDYEVIGPNHEVYLASNQAIAFKLATETPALVADVQLGVKALDGDVSITVAEVGGEEVSLEDISTTTDMYYSIIDCVTWGDTPDTLTDEYYSGVIVITNTSEEDILVSLTNVKMTYTDTPTTSGFGLRMSRESAVEAAAYVADITADGVVEENSGTNTGDDVNDDTTGTESAPGDEESGGEAGDDTTGEDIGSDNTTEEENDTTSAAVSLINTVNKIMQSIRNVLSSILGWLGR